MSDKNEIITEEIYEYYRNNPEEIIEEPDDEEVSENKETFFGSAVQFISGVTDKLAKNPQEKTGLYVTLAVLASVTVILCGCITGILIPPNEAKFESELERLKLSDTRYAEAVKSNERLSARVDTLYNDQAELKAQLDGITDYETARDHSAQDIKDITAQITQLESDIELKQTELAELDEKIKDMGGEITLKPGMYTAGVHIAAGEYQVKGSGSMLVSDSDSKLKVNTKLTKTTAYVCRLSDGDTIKLETEAEFNPAE